MIIIIETKRQSFEIKRIIGRCFMKKNVAGLFFTFFSVFLLFSLSGCSSNEARLGDDHEEPIVSQNTGSEVFVSDDRELSGMTEAGVYVFSDEDYREEGQPILTKVSVRYYLEHREHLKYSRFPFAIIVGVINQGEDTQYVGADAPFFTTHIAFLENERGRILEQTQERYVHNCASPYSYDHGKSIGYAYYFETIPEEGTYSFTFWFFGREITIPVTISAS